MTEMDFEPIIECGAQPLIVAGPCSAESREQVMTTARGCAAAGVHVFRAGVWKPRTRPGSFEGCGSRALGWLREVGSLTGLRIAVEVATPEHVAEAAESGVGIFWLGARTTTDPFAVQAITDALAQCAPGCAVLVKNPVNPDVDLWVGAIERLYRSGIRRLAAVHRGFSTYGEGIYRNTPLWSVALELSVRFPRLPLLCDPSHMGGSRRLVPGLSQRAMQLGYTGLMIECHCCPDRALSDASQQVTPEALAEIIASLPQRASEWDGEALDDLRQAIDALDDELIDLLARRMEVSQRIGALKQSRQLPVLQSSRFSSLLQRVTGRGERLGLDRDFVSRLMHVIHRESVRRQLP